MENGPAGAEAYRLFASALADAGSDDGQVARGAALIMSWAFTRVAVEDSADVHRRTLRRGRARAFVAGLDAVDPESYPIAVRVRPEFFALPMREVFELGLESIIAGLRPQSR